MLELENAKCILNHDSWESDFSLKVNSGESLGIIGASGSGKSTLLNIISGFIPLVSGKIIINNKEIHNLQPGDLPVSMMFQENNLFSHLSVFDNIAIGINPSLKLNKDEIGKVHEAMQRVGLNGFNKRFPMHLSGGQRQRIAIARTLVREKDILLLDEPFSFLDPPLKLEILDLIKDIQNEKQFILIIVTHDFFDCLRVCNKTAFVDHGKIIYQDNTKMFLEKSINIPKINKYLANIFLMKEFQ